MFEKYGAASKSVLHIRDILFAMELSIMLVSKEFAAASTNDSV